VAATRLAQGRSLPSRRGPTEAPAPVLPPGMDEWAAEWIFGRGAVQGVPFDHAVLGRNEDLGPPAFLEERWEQDRAAAEAEAARRAAPVPRGRVEEIPSAFKLSRKPVRPLEASVPREPEAVAVEVSALPELEAAAEESRAEPASVERPAPEAAPAEPPASQVASAELPVPEAVTGLELPAPGEASSPEPAPATRPRAVLAASRPTERGSARPLLRVARAAGAPAVRPAEPPVPVPLPEPALAQPAQRPGLLRRALSRLRGVAAPPQGLGAVAAGSSGRGDELVASPAPPGRRLDRDVGLLRIGPDPAGFDKGEGAKPTPETASGGGVAGGVGEGMKGGGGGVAVGAGEGMKGGAAGGGGGVLGGVGSAIGDALKSAGVGGGVKGGGGGSGGSGFKGGGGGAGGGGAGAGGGGAGAIGGDVTVGGNFSAGTVSIGGSASAGGNVSAGPLEVGGPMTAGGAATLGPVSAGGSAALTAGSAAMAGPVTAGGSASLSAGAAAATGAISAGGSASLTAGGAALTGAISAGGGASVTGGLVKADAVTAGGAMLVGGTVKAGAVTAGSVKAGSISGPVIAGTVIMGGGGGGGAAGGTAARYPADRPLVRLSEPSRSAPRAPSGLLARAPLPQGSSGARLAAAAGLPLEYERAGSATVVFAPGYAEPAPAPAGPSARARVLARQGDDGGGAEAAAEASEATAEVAAAPAPGAAAAAGGGRGGSDNIDEIYEKVVDRLRRDLLVEREKMGDLLGDLL